MEYPVKTWRITSSRAKKDGTALPFRCSYCFNNMHNSDRRFIKSNSMHGDGDIFGFCTYRCIISWERKRLLKEELEVKFNYFSLE